MRPPTNAELRRAFLVIARHYLGMRMADVPINLVRPGADLGRPFAILIAADEASVAAAERTYEAFVGEEPFRQQVQVFEAPPKRAPRRGS